MSERFGFDRVIGQDVAKRILRKAVRENNPAQAYLFVGPEGVGKTSTAYEFAKALNCLDPRNGDACGECVHCLAVEHGNFPDIWVWSPEGKNTKIDQMREMKSRASLPPMRGGWVVNIIEQGDTLNEESANSILKLVEEPPAYLVNILLYRNPAAVLPTIRSRCQLVRFLPAPADELAERLVSDWGCTDEQAAFLAGYSQGCPGKAVRLIADAGFFAARERIANAAREVARNPWHALKAAEVLRASFGSAAEDSDEDSNEGETTSAIGQSKSSKKEALLEALNILTSWYTDLLAIKVHGVGAPLVNSDKRDEIESQAGYYRDAYQVTSCLEAIAAARTAVLGNANPQIATEALLMQLSGA